MKDNDWLKNTYSCQRNDHEENETDLFFLRGFSTNFSFSVFELGSSLEFIEIKKINRVIYDLGNEMFKEENKNGRKKESENFLRWN